MDQNGLDKFPISQVVTPVDPLQRISVVRHLPSNYNEYKDSVCDLDLYKHFMSEQDPVKKKSYAMDLLADFQQNV